MSEHNIRSDRFPEGSFNFDDADLKRVGIDYGATIQKREYMSVLKINDVLYNHFFIQYLEALESIHELSNNPSTGSNTQDLRVLIEMKEDFRDKLDYLAEDSIVYSLKLSRNSQRRQKDERREQ